MIGQRRALVRPQLAGGIIFVEQPDAMLKAIQAHVDAIKSPFQLASIHVMTNLTGSAMLALAHTEGVIDLDRCWAAAHVDEDWNIEKWGYDKDAAERRAQRYEDMRAASQLFSTV